MSSDEEISMRKESQFDDSVDSYSILSTSPPRNLGTSARRTMNTGPKGVRADARAYEASKREANARKTKRNANRLAAPGASLGESGSEASEDEWMSRWREMRMKELSKTGVIGVNLFGQVDDVDARGYLAAVDFEEFEEEDNSVAAKRVRGRRNVVTVVLIYNNVRTSPPFLPRLDVDEKSPDSKIMFQVFSRLARRYPTTHFLRLPSHYAEDMPSTALPAVLAYRQGGLIANLVHFVDELDPGLTINVPSVESILKRYFPALTNKAHDSGKVFCRLTVLKGIDLFDVICH